jgi:hypothetical protein
MTPKEWLGAHAAGLVCVAVGLTAVAIGSLGYLVAGDEIARIPDVRVTAPLLVGACAAAVVSLVRREGVYALSVCGVGLAGAAMVLGWVIVVGIIALVSALVILLLHQLM